MADIKTPWSVIPGNGTTSQWNRETQEKWYAGDRPTSRELLGQIASISEYDMDKANDLYGQYKNLTVTPNNPFYNPYSMPTNKAVGNLAAMGIDTSKIDDDFYKNNAYLTNYLIRNGTTSTPTKPGVKASIQQKAAYEYYQLWNSEDATVKAEQQWADLQNELTYWAQRTDRNYSDDEIISRIDWSKYDELDSMDKNKDIKPNEYNRAIGYSRDAMYAVLWKARNPEYIGDLEPAMAFSYLGYGNQWQENPEIAKKLIAGTDDYSPYSVGSTMEEQGLYFGVQEFNQQWIDDHAKEFLNSKNATAKQYYADVVIAEDYTKTLESQLEAMNNQIDSLMKLTTNPDEIINTVFANEASYGDLFDLDDSMRTGALKNTTRAVNYSRKEIERYIRERCQSEKNKAGVAEVSEGVGGKAMSESETAIEAAGKELLEALSETVGTVGTDAEKTAYAAGKTTAYDPSVKNIMMVSPEVAYQRLMSNSKDKIAAGYVDNYNFTSDYESRLASKEEKQANLDSVQAELKTLLKKEATANVAAERNKELSAIAAMNGDPIWEHYKYWLEQEPENGGANEERNSALLYLYRQVTGDYGWDNLDKAYEQAEAMWDAIKQEDVQWLTPEELERKDELERWKDALLSEIQEDNDYLKKNERKYTRDKESQEFIKRQFAATKSDEGLIDNIEYLCKIGKTSAKTEYSAYNKYDQSVVTGESTREDASASAVADATLYAQNYTALTETYDYLTKNNVKFDEATVKNIEANKKELLKKAKDAGYVMLDTADDFIGVSDAGIKKALDGFDSAVGYDFGETYMLAKAFEDGHPESIGLLLGSQRGDLLANISPEEIRRYFYLHEKDGEEAATEYLNWLTDPDEGVLAVRSAANLRETMKEFASQPGLNPYIATVIGLGESIVSLPRAGAYRIGQALKGEEVSPYNPAYNSQIIASAAVEGTKEALVTSCNGLFGDGNFVSQALTRLYDIGFGGAKMAVGSAAATELFGALGVPLRELSASLTTDTLKVKILKSAAEVLPTTLASSEEKYRSVLLETKDETKAGLMYNISLVSGLLTHSVVMNGIHAAYQTDPTKISSGVSGLIEKIISTDTAVAGSTIASSTINKFADKAIMKADGEWGKNFEKYKSMGFSKTMAEQAADSDMWQSVVDETLEAVINATVRTVAVAGAGAIGSGLEKASKKVKETWADVKAFAKKEFSTDSKTWIEDDNGNPIAIEDLDPEAFKVYDAGYDVKNGVVRDADGNVVAPIPNQMIPNRLGQTMIVDRKSATSYTAIGYVADVDNGTISLVTTKAEGGRLVQIPYEDVAYNFGKEQIVGNVPDSYNLEREYGLLGEVSDRYSGNVQPIDDYVYASPVTPEMAKDLTILGEAHDANTTGAAVAISGFLNSGNPNVDKAAGQTIVSVIAGGDPSVAADAMQQMILNTPNPATMKSDVIAAAFTNGNGRQELERIAGKVAEGGTVTADDVKALHEAIVSDRKSDPNGFSTATKNAVIENRIANATIQKAAGDARISMAKSAVQAAMRKLAEREKALDDARAERDAAVQNAQDATDAALMDAGNKNNLGPVQQTWEHASKMDSNVSAAEDKVAEQQEVVKTEQENLDKANTEVMTEKRKEAVSEVNQQVQEETEAKAEATVEAVKPIAAFIQTDESGNTIPGRYGRPTHMTFEAYDADGNAVSIVGVYDVVDNYVEDRGGNMRPTDPTIIYVTSDGRLVREAVDFGDPRFGEVSTEELDEAAQAAIERTIQSVRSRGENARTRVRHPAIAPKVYLPSSFPMDVNGQQVQMIGFAGKKTVDGEEYPVFRGMDGKDYVADENFETPFDYRDDVNDLFEENADSLPEMDGITIQKENENVGEERQENSGTAGLTVQGTVGEGDNTAELAEPLGRDDRPGDNGNAELGSEEHEASLGRGTEGTALDNGQTESRGDARLRNIINERLQEDQSANDPHLSEEKDYGRFSLALDEAKASNAHGLYVDSQSPDALTEKGAIALLSLDGMAGVAVATKGNEAGNIFGVFNNPKSEIKHTLPYLLTHAIANGGNKLDCFNGYLARQYERYGFIPVARVPFNREYAPEGWNYERDGEPDVIVWMHNGDLADVVAQRFMFTEADGGYHRYTDKEMASLPVFDDYDEALAHRDMMLANRDRSEGQFMYTHALPTKYLDVAIQSGGVAGISVGVTKMGQKSGVLNFGQDKENNNCIIFLYENSVDPENNPLNLLFGDDAFTPMFSEDIEWRDGKFVNVDTGEPVTREDIVKMMEKEDVLGMVTRRYSSLKEAKDDAGRLVSDESIAYGYSNPVNELDNAFMNIYEQLSDEVKALFKDDFDFMGKMNEVFPKAYKYNETTPEELQKALESQGITITKEQAADLIEAGDKVNNLLTDYFEAKLMRDVPTSEWAGVGVDKNRPDLAEKLNEMGIPTILLDPETKQEQAWAFYKTLLDAQGKTPTDENGNAIITPPETAEQPVEETPNVPSADVLATEQPVTDVGTPAAEEPKAAEVPLASPNRDRVQAPEEHVGPVTEQRQWGREGAQDSKILHQQTKDRIAENNSYFVDVNNEQWDRALKWISEHATQSDPTGLYGAVAEIESEGFNLWTVDGQARLGAAIALAAESGDVGTETRLSETLFNPLGTDIGQALQFRKFFNMMTPSGRKMSLTRAAQRVEDYYASRGMKLKDANGNPIKLKPSDKVLEMAANAKSEAEFAKAQRAMEKELAEKLPSDWGLKLRTFRITAMLSGTKTHIRNIGGNLGNALMYEVRNAISTGLERLWGVKPGERTKSIARSPESVEFARADVKHMLPQLQGQAKYYETHNVDRERKAWGSGRGRTAIGRFVSKTLGRTMQGAANVVSYALEKEDMWFLELQYVRALSGYMTANKLTGKDMRGSTLTKARSYAVEEAWDATFRKANTVATWLGNTGNKYIQWGVNAIQPFLKTPLNIAKTGVEFSPVGLVNTILRAKKRLDAYDEWEKNGFKGKRPKNAQSTTEFISKLSAGLTGTMISGLGYYLASIGVLKTRVSDTDKLHGEQDFSLVIGGKSRDIKWLIPVNIPLFFGAELYNQIEKLKGKEITDGWDALGTGLNVISDELDPLIETTLFSSLNSFLTTPRYVGNDESIPGALAQKLGANYISSFFPAIVGDIAKTIDPTKRKAYTESGDNMSLWKSMLEQLQNKTPYLSMRNVAYINEWGEEQTTDTFNTILKNFLLPGEIKTLTDAEVDNKLQEIYDTTQTISVLPKHIKSVTINKEKINFTAEQYHDYNQIRGKESKKALEELVDRPEFKELEEYPEIQANIVGDVYKYAKAKAAQAIFPQKKFTGWEKGALEARNIIDYIFKTEEEKAKKADVSSHKEALVRGITSSSLEGARTDISFLRNAGVEDSSIKSYVTEKVKPIYREADDEERSQIESMLQLLGIGYENYNFSNWLKSTDQSSYVPTRPSSDKDWDRYMDDLDAYWQNYDFAKNDPVGQYGKGTIDMNNRTVVNNPDGSISTEKSFSFYDEETGKEVLIPLIVDGKELTEEEAIEHYYDTVKRGKPEYLGMFDDWKDADEYAVMLHNRGDWYYNR